MLSRLLVVIALLLVPVLVFLAMLWWRQERIVFQPPLPLFADAGSAPRVDYVAADGQRLFGYLVGPRTGAPGVLIVFHGNADLAVWQLSWAEEVARRTGWLVLIAEYRGYGGLDGTPTYTNSQLDARAAWAFARDSLGARPERTAIFGHSLGSAIAAELAEHMAPHALLLQSPFTSARDMARRMLAHPMLLVWSSVSRVHYDTERLVREMDTPVWVAHGEGDTLIPVAMGRRVFAAARRRGEQLIVPAAGHNDVADVGGDEYWAWIARALRVS